MLKRISVLIVSAALILLLFGCAAPTAMPEDSEYALSGSVALSVEDETSLDKTIVSYTFAIRGTGESVKGVVSQTPIVNPEYEDLLITDGPHTAQLNDEFNPSIDVEGSFVFNTTGKTKEEISAMVFLTGFRLTDNAGKVTDVLLNYAQ